MITFKKNASVSASTIRGTTSIPGRISGIKSTAKGDWYTIKPDDRSLKEFTTRAAKIELR